MAPMTQPSVGIALLLFNSKGEILLGKRKSSHGSGTWAMPGGHLEMWENPVNCAKRELLEETGMKLEKDPHLVYVSNDFYNQGKEDGKHYITLFLTAMVFDQEPVLMEPDKCEGWQWFNPAHTEMFSPTFASTDQLLGNNTDFFYFYHQLRSFRKFFWEVTNSVSYDLKPWNYEFVKSFTNDPEYNQ